MPDSIVALRTFPRRWRAALALLDEEDDAVLRRRPAPEVWSALEYAAHTRDTVAANGWVMSKALTEDHPVIDWPDDDVLRTRTPSEAASASTALDELGANLERVATSAERTDPGDWRRPATIREPGTDGEEVDALWFLHHTVHEASHHLRDVHRVLQQVRGRP